MSEVMQPSASARVIPRTVDDLMRVNDAAARNILDMIEDAELANDDHDRIAELYAAQEPCATLACRRRLGGLCEVCKAAQSSSDQSVKP
jgi:hypothetical protein